MRAWFALAFLLSCLTAPAVIAAPRAFKAADAESDAGRLLKAATQQGPQAVRQLLRQGLSANARDGRKTPILIGLSSLIGKRSTKTTSARHSRNTRLLQSVQVLLREGKADPNAHDGAYVGDSRSALHMAAASGNRTLVRLLLQYGADPHKPTRFGETPVYFAAQEGHLEVVYDLVRSGARIDLFTKHTHMSPLLAAATRGQWLMVRYLITLGADPRAKDTFGKTAAEIARDGYYKSNSPARRKRLAQTYLELDRALVARAAQSRKIVLR